MTDKADNAKPEKKAGKHPRGRPIGSSRFIETDNANLIKAADRIVRNPDLKLAPVFKSLGYHGDSEIRRMRSHWSKRSEQLLADAQRRWDAEPPKTVLDEFTSFLVTIGGWVKDFSGSHVVQDLEKSMQSATRRREARQQFGSNPQPPFDIKDPDESRKALSRFKGREHQSIEELSGALPEDKKTFAELPLSTKLEIASMLLHEMSLDQLENEQAEATDTKPTQVAS